MPARCAQRNSGTLGPGSEVLACSSVPASMRASCWRGGGEAAGQFPDHYLDS